MSNKLLRAAACSGAALTAITAAVYEGVLNINVNNFISSKINVVDPAQTDACANDYNVEAGNWWGGAEKRTEKLEYKNGSVIYAVVIPAEKDSGKWAIINHGYTSGPDGMSRYAMEYHKRGYNCLLPYLRGHGKDKNRYCSMGWYDKDYVVAWAQRIVTWDENAQIVIHGESMGAATTMLATGEYLPANVKAAVEDCGYTTVMEQYEVTLKANHIPPHPVLDMLNAYSHIAGKFDFNKTSPIEAVARSVTPTLFVHGEADNLIPISMMDEVYNACSAPKDKFTVPGAAHASSSSVDPEYYWKKVDEFLVKFIK